MLTNMEMRLERYLADADVMRGVRGGGRERLERDMAGEHQLELEKIAAEERRAKSIASERARRNARASP